MTYCYRPTSVVCLSVTLVSPAKMAELMEITFGLRIWVGSGNHVLDGGPDPPMRRGSFEGGRGKWRPIVKYRDTLRSSLQRWLNWSRCRLGCVLRWAIGIVLDGSPELAFWLSMGYNFGCMIASDTLFDSWGVFSGSSYPMKTWPRSSV